MDETTYTQPCRRPDETYRALAQRIQEKNGAVLSTTILPNWSYEWMQPPKGSVIELDASAAFTPSLFSVDMWQSTTVTSALIPPSKLPLDVQSCTARVLAAVPLVAEKPAGFPSEDDDGGGSVVSGASSKRLDLDWTPSLGDPTRSNDAFIGLYSTNRPLIRRASSDSRQSNYDYIICRAGIDDRTYEEMESYFEECGKMGATISETLFGRRIEKFKALLRYNRQRLVYNFATALGIDVRTRELHDGTIVAPHAFETMSNDVAFDESAGTVRCYNDCGRSDMVTTGLVVTRSPQQGPLVYQRRGGVNGSWRNRCSGAFPTHLGRLTPDEQVKCHNHLSDSALRHTIVSEATSLPDHPGVARHLPTEQRTNSWRSIEASLGYTFNTVVECQPRLVRI